MRIKYFILLLLAYPSTIYAQNRDTLTLRQCYQLAQKHYPVLQQDPLLKQQLALTLKNLNTRYLPGLSLQAQATYQSEVTSIPFKLPGMDIPEVPKAQYRAALNVQQLIYDGGTISKQKNLQQTATALSLQQQEITFHQLKKQLNEWYTTVLITQAKEQALTLQQYNLTQQIKQTEAAIKNGAALPSQSDELRVALLQAGQQLSTLEANHKAGIKALRLVTGASLSDTVHLTLPEEPAMHISDSIQRPELKHYTLQDQLLQQQSSLLKVKTLPKINAFVQGGYGRPGLNMLNNDFDWFYMAGIKFNWNLWDWNNKNRKQRSLQLETERLHLKKNNFLLQTNIALSNALSKIHSLEKNLQKDKQIVRFRHKIRKTASSQLTHGVITPTEYLIKLNDETNANIQQQIHIIRLRFSKLNYELLKNN